MLKKVLLIFFIILIGGAILGGLYFWNQVNWSVSDSDDEVIFSIFEGEGVNEIAGNLHEGELIISKFWFGVYVYLDRSQSNFIAGNYLLKPNLNIREVVSILTAGNTTPENIITVIEGWNTREIADYLHENGIVERNDFLTLADATDSRTVVTDKTFDFLLDKPFDKGLEGYLFPDTYRIYEDSSSSEIIERMLDNFGQKFTDEMKQAAEDKGRSIFEIITLASILEKEVRTDEDRKIASGIFYDRIANGVALQSDATVNYVTGKQMLQPSLDDLEVDNKYNTYKYRGLPPGPISNPSLSAINAALYPADTDYFYFLTKPDGSTVFSKTYEEHLENKRKYL